MAATPETSILLPANSLIGENVDLTISFDNTDTVQTGYGPFVLFYLDKTGADGDDGLSFNSASYLGADITTTEITLDNTGTSTFEVFGVEQTITTPTDFGAGDSLVVLELPFGSFVSDQPQADISVNLTGNINSDLDTPINLQTQGGFVFGNTPTEETDGSDDPIYEDISSDSVDTISPQLVTLTKNYIGPEDETATGPNFLRQFELVVDIADGQTITNLDVTDILPDNMQFVDVVSIVDSNGNPVTASNIASPDDDGLNGNIGSTNQNENTGATDSIPTPGGILSRRIDTITGTSEAKDLVLTYEFFIPRLDDDSDVIINADTGDDIISTNESQLGDNNPGDSNNIWNPEDGRDDNEEVYIPPTASNPNFPTHDLEDQSIAIQKDVSNVSDSQNTPEDILRYEIDFQVSDYFAFQNINVVDTFSDGQRFYNASGFEPTLEVSEHGSNSAITNFDLTNYIVDTSEIGNDTNPDTDGSTKVTFEISDELMTRDFDDDDGILIGGGVPDGGFNNGGTSLNNNPPLPNGATEGKIVFYTQIQQEYSDTFESGDASVDLGDELTNNAIIQGEVLNVDDLSTTEFDEEDDTSAGISIEEGKLHKSIYAINGEIYDANNDSGDGFSAATDTDLSNGLDGYDNAVNVAPGDEITYRLTYELPTTDIEDLTLTDYFPLPIFDVGTEFASPTFDPTVSIVPPDAGSTKYGNLDTFSGITNAPDPTLTAQGGANSLTYSYGDFDTSINQSSTIDLLVTVTASDLPAADGLLYTNQVRQTNNTTLNEDSFLDKIVQVTLDQPEILGITKGVVAYNNNGTSTVNPDFTNVPSGVAFATGGETTFTGVSDPVSSTDLQNNPIDSDLNSVELEAGDIVTFAIAVENTGNSRKGVFDLTLKDDLPSGFVIPSGGINLNVTDGKGATINYTGLGDPSSVGDDFFGNGIELIDPGSTPAIGAGTGDDTDAGAIDAYDPDDGSNIAIATFDLEVSDSAPYQPSLSNTATLDSYASTEGGSKFTGSTDTASIVTVAPEPVKSIAATSEAHTDEDGDGTANNNAGRRKTAIGEIVRYRLVTTLPEGEAQNFYLRDRLPYGLQFLDDGTAKAAFVSDDAPITSTTTDTAFSNKLDLGLGDFADFSSITGNLNEDLWVNGTTDIDGVVPVFVLPDENVGSDRNIGNDSTNADPDEYYSSTDVYFKFGDITNPDDDVDDEYVVVEFNALVTNDAAINADGDIIQGNSDRNDENESRTNRFDVNVGRGSNLNNRQELAVSNQSYTRIVEPELDLVKEIKHSDGEYKTDTLLTDSGNTVEYRLSLDNDGSVSRRTTAFEVDLSDRVPDGLTLTGIDQIVWNDGVGAGGSGTETNITSGTSFTAGDMTITPTFDVGTGTILIEVDQMPRNADIQVFYSASTNNTVNPDTILTETAEVEYTSLPGTGTKINTVAEPTSNDTGSTVNGTASGDSLGERDSTNGENPPASDQPGNDYAASSSVGVQISPLEPTKSIASTSETHTIDDDVTIGEIVRYQLAVKVPEGKTDGFVITDELPDGLIYLNDNTTKLAFVDNDPSATGGITSSTISGAGLNITGDAVTTPTFDLTTGISSEIEGDTTFISGEDVIFNLGDIVNGDRDPDSEYVVVEFNALVENTGSNVDGAAADPLNNLFKVAGTNATERTSNSVAIDLVEPSITNVAQTVSSTTGDAQDTLTYTVTFTNNGTATAFDVNLTDAIPDQLQNLGGTITVDIAGTATTNFTDNSNRNATAATGNNLDITLNDGVGVGETVTITYTADIIDGIAPATIINSSATVNYTSLPGDDAEAGTAKTDANNPTGSDINNTTSGNTNSDRNSSTNGDGASVNNYTDSDPATVTIDALDAVKTIPAGDFDVTIGETVRYRLAVELPEGNSDNFKITDALPDGITYSGNPEIAFVSTNSGASAGVYSDDSNIGSTPQTTSIPNDLTVTLDDSAIADAGGDNSFDSGEDVIFSLGNITNADNDSESEYVIIEFDGIVDGVGTDGSLDNQFTVTAAADNSISDTSEIVTVDVDLDYGDAPDSGNNTTSPGDYLTTLAAGGASHGIRNSLDNTLTIGSTIDADNGSLQDTAADADGADDDGVTLDFLETGASSYTIDVSVLNDTNEPATLVGWIDFNGNGSFESEEGISQPVPVNSTAQNIELKWDNNNDALPNLPGMTAGDTYARFRLSTDSDLTTSTSAGILDDGEVEDYKLTIYNTVMGNPFSDPITEDNNVPDIITAGEGQDTLTGGTGEDRFVYTKTSDGVDIIEDFEDGIDKIDFSAIVAGELSAINFSGTDPIAAGYVDIIEFGSHTMIQVDFDNSNTLQKDVVLLDNIPQGNITAADFIF